MSAVGTILGYDAVPAKADALRVLPKFRFATPDELIAGADIVIEAASQAAVREYAESVLAAGKPFVVLSVGALADGEFAATLFDLCKTRGGTILVPSGAVGGLDALAAAKLAGLEDVELETRKPPGTLGVQADRETILFEGDATEAVRRFPTTVNVAATLALAGLGAARTRVRVVADPQVKGNIHRIRARGRFGRMELTFETVPFPENPRTSMLAAYSTLALLTNLQASMLVGT